MRIRRKKSLQEVPTVKPVSLNLQTRPFALNQSQEAKCLLNPQLSSNSNSHHSQNLLEKLISTPKVDSAVIPVQRKPQNRLKLMRSQQMRIPIQAKLSVGEANDRYEKEADNTATKVVQQINSPTHDNSVQRQELMETEDESLQRNSLVQRRENLSGEEASTDLESAIQNARGSGQSLDVGIKAKMGQAMGADFSDVKVHTDSQSDQLNRSIQAKAFTTGKDVFFRQGEYAPSSKSGQELIAHELTHVVQQQGSGTKTVQRLITAEELSSPEKAGVPKKDKKFGIGKLSFTKKMSGLYKSVLISLDQYHKYKPGIINHIQNRRDKTAFVIKQLLENVKTACQNYFNEHSDVETDPRTRHITTLFTSAAMEIKAVDAIAKNPSYGGMDWKMAIAPFMRMHELSSSGELTDSQFHGSGGGLLDKIDGRIMSGAALEEEGIIRDTGEGDFFSRAKGDDEKSGEKNFISTGQSLSGMGTALQYAIAASDDKNYNTARYTDDELDSELNKLDMIIENWDESLNQIPSDDIMGARRNLSQFKNLHKRLDGERKMRENLPPNHARRRGETYSDSTYGLVLEFASHGLDITNPRPHFSLGEDDGFETQRPLGGERSINAKSIDLRDPGRLLRVYCPLANMETVRQKVSTIVKHDNFEVIPFEALVNMPDAMIYTKIATAELLENLYEKTRQMVLEAYATGMQSGKTVDKQALVTASKRLGL
jgi:hypothetical protein